MDIERGGPIPHEDKPESDDSSSKKREGFLSGFLRREDSGESTPLPPERGETDDDDEEEDKSLGAMLLKAFKGKEAEHSEDEPTDEEEEKLSLFESTEPESTDEETAIETPETPIELAPIEQPATIEAPVDTQPIADEEPLPELPPDLNVETGIPDEEVAPETAEPTPIVEQGAGAPPETPPEAPGGGEEQEPEEEPEETPQMQQVASQQPLGPRPVIDTDPTSGVSIPSAPESVTPNITINNRGINPAVPLVGLGIAAYEHHRITKSKHESEKRDKAQQEQIDKLANEQAKQRYEAAEAARRTAEQSAQQIEEFRRAVEQKELEARQAKFEAAKLAQTEVTKAKATESQMPKPEAQPAKAPEVAEKSKEVIQDKAPSVGEVIAERTAKLREQEPKQELKNQEVIANTPNVTHLDTKDILKPGFKEKAPELLLQQTEAAAELDVAQEKQYELRHELKDVASGSQTGAGAGFTPQFPMPWDKTDDKGHSTSPTLQDIHAPITSLGNSKLTDEKQRQAYRQAMWAGLWGGLLVILAVAIWAIST